MHMLLLDVSGVCGQRWRRWRRRWGARWWRRWRRLLLLMVVRRLTATTTGADGLFVRLGRHSGTDLFHQSGRADSAAGDGVLLLLRRLRRQVASVHQLQMGELLVQVVHGVYGCVRVCVRVWARICIDRRPWVIVCFVAVCVRRRTKL